jgi:DNA damage-inducible protein 1
LQKRHQACIDLSTNTLRIAQVEIPFLSEHELPEQAKRRHVEEVGQEMGQAAAQGVRVAGQKPGSVAAAAAAPGPAVQQTRGKPSEKDLETVRDDPHPR